MKKLVNWMNVDTAFSNVSPVKPAISKQLSDYSVEDLQNLQLALSIAMQEALKQDTVLFGASLVRIADDVTEALKDKQFDLSVNPLPFLP